MTYIKRKVLPPKTQIIEPDRKYLKSVNLSLKYNRNPFEYEDPKAKKIGYIKY